MRLLYCALAASIPAVAAAAPLGQFTDHRDIGRPASPGAASFQANSGTYTITGVGRNMWADHDDFHFAWKRMSGDVVADTKLRFVTPSPASDAMGYLHRKGGIVLRQDLDPDSAYVDALRMGNQQMSLQYREVKGGPTRLIWINTPRQAEVRLVKIGDYAYLATQGPDGKLRHAGGSFKLHISGPYYIGLGVCPHDETARETMAFSDVAIRSLPRGAARPRGATLQTIHVDTVAEQTVLYHSASPITTSGWSADSQQISFSSGGTAWRATAWDSNHIVRAKPQRAGTYSEPAAGTKLGISQRMSPDRKWIAYLTGEPTRVPSADQDVILRVAPVVNGKAAPEKAVTLVKFWGNAASLPTTAWSPDGKTIAFISHD